MGLEAFSDSLDPGLLTDIMPGYEQEAISLAAEFAHRGENVRANFWRGAAGYRNCLDGPSVPE